MASRSASWAGSAAAWWELRPTCSKAAAQGKQNHVTNDLKPRASGAVGEACVRDAWVGEGVVS